MLDESRFVMTFSTILAVTEIRNFRLALEGKTDKEIPKSSRLEFSEKFLAKNFFIRCRKQQLWVVEWGGNADFPMLRTLLAIHPKPWEPNF